MQLYPEVSVELDLSNRYVDLIDGGFDAIFRIGELSDSGLIARQLRPYRLVLCASPRYMETHEPLLTPDDLTRHECLGFSHTELRTTWAFDGPTGRETVQVKGHLMSDSGEAIVCAGLCGAGVMLQPAELVTPYLQSGQLIEILPEYKAPTRPMHLVHTPDRRMTPTQNNLVEVHFTLTSLQHELSRILEPRASLPKARIDTIRRLSEAGIPVKAMFSPVIPGVNNQEMEAVMTAARSAGATCMGDILIRLPHEVRGLFSDWLEQHMPQLKTEVMKRIDECRADFSKQFSFETRMTGEGLLAERLLGQFRHYFQQLGFREISPDDLDHTRFTRRFGSPQLELF